MVLSRLRLSLHAGRVSRQERLGRAVTSEKTSCGGRAYRLPPL